MGNIRLARWKSPKGRAEYIAAYAAALSLWPVPYDSVEVPTDFGPTHVLASGPEGWTQLTGEQDKTALYPARARPD